MTRHWNLVALPGYSPIESFLFSWVLLVSFLAFVLMGVDKAGARMRSRRISENSLGTIALAGGFLGVVLGGLIFHHKVSKPRFWTPVIVSLLLWTMLFAIVFGFFQV